MQEISAHHSNLFRRTQKAAAAAGMQRNSFAGSSVKGLKPRERPKTLELREIYRPTQPNNADVDSDGNNPLHKRLIKVVNTEYTEEQETELLDEIAALASNRQYLNLQNQQGKTPLMIAIEQAPLGLLDKICKTLTDMGADATIPDKDGKSVRTYLHQKQERYRDPLTPNENASIGRVKDLFDNAGVKQRRPFNPGDPHQNPGAYLYHACP